MLRTLSTAMLPTTSRALDGADSVLLLDPGIHGFHEADHGGDTGDGQHEKKSTAKTWPPGICAKATGSVWKIRPGPAAGSRP
jgi:hypothetical protein